MRAFIGTPSFQARQRHKGLLFGSSLSAIALLTGAQPATAQLAGIASRSLKAPVITPVAVPIATVNAPLTLSATLARQAAHAAQAKAIQSYVAQARAALVPASAVTDGLSAAGLNPVANGVAAALDPTGIKTWQGASVPTQSSDSNGHPLVLITQTDSRAILTWNSFNVGANTTLQYKQQVNGVAQPSWVAVNRVIGNTNPTQILGNLKADGTVVVINQAGVIFGQNSQVNLHSLLATTLDLGPSLAASTGGISTNPNILIGKDSQGNSVYESGYTANTIQNRNLDFLQNGLLLDPKDITQLSALLPASPLISGLYDVHFVGSNIAGSNIDLTDPLEYADVAKLETGAPINPLNNKGGPNSNTASSFDAINALSSIGIVFNRGAQVNASNGGFIIAAANNVVNDGTLTAPDGQVSLQAGKSITYSTSNGGAGAKDPYARGLILGSTANLTETSGGSVTNSGLISVPRGYISLGADLLGSVTNSGLLSATTSVSANGKISLTAGTVRLTGASDPNQASAIVITPDTNGATVPLGTATNPPQFNSSQIDILATGNQINIAQNALILAPNATVNIVATAAVPNNILPPIPSNYDPSVNVAIGATIDVSGVADVVLPASTNAVQISPLTANDLANTPLYRDSNTTGAFTLNGATVYIDPRISGVRADGTAWVGSPLLNGGAVASQIPVTAAQLMTKGGNISITVPAIDYVTVTPANVPHVNIAKGANLDFAGGWVDYGSGTVPTTNLLTSDGRVVNIANANPNDAYIAIASGFTQVESNFGVSRTFQNILLKGTQSNAGYTEGRDAGSLIINAPTAMVNAALNGAAYAGSNQIIGAVRPTANPGKDLNGNVIVAGDTRKLQATAQQLPSGGFVSISSFTGGGYLGADIVVYHGDPAAVAQNYTHSEFLLNDDSLSSAGLSGLLFQTSGQVNFLAGTNLNLANGGALKVDAGRTITFGGNITAPSGSITAQTYNLFGVTGNATASFNGIGSPFNSTENLSSLYAVGSAPPSPFDINVSGTLSTAGLWVNDFQTNGPALIGKAWGNGGSISLTVAPEVFVPMGTSVATAQDSADLSGSITIANDALLDVASGGYVTPAGVLQLTAKGGNVSLIDDTVYAALLTGPIVNDGTGRYYGQSVTTSPYTIINYAPTGNAGDGSISTSYLPSQQRSAINFISANLRGFGFGGGGTFTFVGPNAQLGDQTGRIGPKIGTDFLTKTGFGALNLSVWSSQLYSGLFSNGLTGTSAFLQTSTFEVASGNSFNLTQTVLPSLLNMSDVSTLLSLGSGSDIASVLTPFTPTNPFYAKPATLQLGGLTEFDVDAGGTLIGAPQAQIIAPKIYNAGTINIAGGSLTQLTNLPLDIATYGIGIRSIADPQNNNCVGLDCVFGTAVNGQYSEDSFVNTQVVDTQRGDGLSTVGLTNGKFLQVYQSGYASTLYFLGKADSNVGIDLAAGSTTNLSGTTIYDPTARILQNGVQQVTGRIISGGNIAAASAFTPSVETDQKALFAAPAYGKLSYIGVAAGSIKLGAISPGELLNIRSQSGTLAAASVNISGANAVFDELVSGTQYAKVTEWSNGGSISALAGGSIAGGAINAQGGATSATGGTLTWLNPTLSAVDPGAATDGTICANQLLCSSNVLYANQVSTTGNGAAGFSSVVALGGLTVTGATGDVNLSLNKSFLLQSAPATVANAQIRRASEAVTVNVLPGANATITAPYIRLSSQNQQFATNDNKIVQQSGSGNLTVNATSALDLVGAVYYNVPTTTGTVNFNSATDIRFIGVEPLLTASYNGTTGVLTGTPARPSLSGQIISNGNINFTAAQVYATTGTGNLQQYIQDQLAGNSTALDLPFLVASTNPLGTVSIAGNGTSPAAPLSAGTYVEILANTINQNGILRAPLGLLQLGSNTASLKQADLFNSGSVSLSYATPATRSISFGTNSVTSVSGTGLNVPYGTTTDKTEYFFTANTSSALTAPPTGALNIAASTISVNAGATVDGRGGGDVFAYEFVPGTGGSRDVLNFINPVANDPFSSNNGYLFSDKRQVYAIVPASQAALVAAYDPLYSVNYDGSNPNSGVNLYGANAGLGVTLDAAPGIIAGQYVLLPAQYAVLPGAYRVVQNVASAATAINGGSTLLDGTIQATGAFSTAGTNLSSSSRVSFSIQSQSVWSKYSQIATTQGTQDFNAIATKNNAIAPRSPLDAARVVLAPLASLQVAGAFLTTPATGGRGAQVDISGTNIEIAASGAAATNPNAVLLTTDTLSNLNANSLLIGGQRVDNVDGTTTLAFNANTLTVDSGVNFTVPELLLGVSGNPADAKIASTLTIQDGVTLTASGALSDSRTGDYIIPSADVPLKGGYTYDPNGIGSVLRLSSGPERLIQRTGSATIRETLSASTLKIGAATLNGNALALDTTRLLSVGKTTTLNAPYVAISDDIVDFNNIYLNPNIQAQLANTKRLTLRSPGVIAFAKGNYNFNDLTIDASGIGLNNLTAAQRATQSAVTITAGHVVLRNAQKDLGDCHGNALVACGGAGNALTLNATDIALGSGNFRTYGFDGGVTLNASQGVYVQGVGSFTADGLTSAPAVPLTINAPFIADSSLIANPSQQTVIPKYTFSTLGNFALVAPSGASVTPTGNAAPGSQITIDVSQGTGSTITVDGALVRATAGIVGLKADGLVNLLQAASLQTPGYTKTFGSAQDAVTVSAGGGTVSLQSDNGNINTSAASSLVVDTGVGTAGTLNLFASQGQINLASQLNPGVASGTARLASFIFDAGASPFDFASFVASSGPKFGGDISINAGLGNLVLTVGQTLRAASVSLTANDSAAGAGQVNVAGIIDTSGDNVASLRLSDPNYIKARVSGGNIALYGAGGVSLAPTAVLETQTYGYAAADSRQAKAGDVTLGIGTNNAASISLAPSATIDVSAKRVGQRLIPFAIKDAVTGLVVTAYNVAQSDAGGIVNFRAPLVGPNDNLVDVQNSGTIKGASAIKLEAYNSYDLNALAASGKFAGISSDGAGGITLDAGATTAGKANFLSDVSAGTLPSFVQNFSVSAKDGESLAEFTDLQPGIQLNAKGDITTKSVINLGAGNVNTTAALNAGDLAVSSLGAYADGSTRYYVVSGHEQHLFDNFVSLTYRVGGSIGGEAPVFTLRAGNNLNVNNSITDGFFSFQDQTDPQYINYQLGGGNRTYQPTARLTCGSNTANCSAGATYSGVVTGVDAGGLTNAVVISLLTAQKGNDYAPFTYAPYSASANDVAAQGVGTGGSGDPLGTATLFPLSADGSAAHSSTINLVGGAGSTVSVNPIHTSVGVAGSVNVQGDHSYQVALVSKGSTSTYVGPLQLLSSNLGAPLALTIDNVDQFLADQNSLFTYSNPDEANNSAGDTYTNLSWGSSAAGIGKDAYAAWLKLFPGTTLTASQANPTFTGTKNNVTGVYAPLSSVLLFLSQNNFGGTYANGVESPHPKYNSLTPVNAAGNLNLGPVSYGTLVRTGSGTINVAAAGDINLLRTSKADFEVIPKSTAADNGLHQVGGTAIYTAGVRINPANINGAVLPNFADVPLGYIPGTNGLLDSAPVAAANGGAILLSAGGAITGRQDNYTQDEIKSGVGVSLPASLVKTILNNRLASDVALTSGGGTNSTFDTNRIGSVAQPWLVSNLDAATTQLVINPQLFTSGVSALAGGHVTVRAGGTVSDLTVAAENSVVTGTANAGKALFALGSGNVNLSAGGDVLGGAVYIASGVGVANVGGAVLPLTTNFNKSANLSGDPLTGTLQNSLIIGVADSTFHLNANGVVDVGAISSLASPGYLGGSLSESAINDNASGYFSPIAGVSIASNNSINLLNNSQPVVGFANDVTVSGTNVPDKGYVLPPSLSLTSLNSDVTFGEQVGGFNSLTTPSLLYPSAVGQLQLIAGGNLQNFGLAMSDAAPYNLPSIFSSVLQSDSTGFRFPGSSPTYHDTQPGLLHNPAITHLGDTKPALIYVGGSISDVTLFLAKQAQISAGQDITNLYFEGQNVATTDNTLITAGRDIVGTVGVDQNNKSYVQGNNIIVGGPGTLFVEAGRNLGPFLSSDNTGKVAYAGGITTVGRNNNPFLPSTGANIYTLFGVVNGIDYAALSSTYLDPANAVKLDGALFVQNIDLFGNKSPDRTRPIYAPLLAQWLKTNAPNAYTSVFGSADAVATDTQAYAQLGALYSAFSGLPSLQQDRFLLGTVFFDELKAPADPANISYQQYVRSYRVVNTLFPASAGYTDNLATYTTNPATISADHPLGIPTKNIVNGQPAVATKVETGNADLRLSTIETQRQGDIYIFGPGGNFVAGSVVSTAAQLANKDTAVVDNFYQGGYTGFGTVGFQSTSGVTASPINAIPLGFEGILTLRGGTINTFTDGNFLLNQSRLFTVGGGDITMFSANGNLNAGEGPKTSSNFPPITVQFDQNGFSEDNTAGSISGAGIAALQPTPQTPASSVTLVAPVGTVDAGAAGVRASGNLFVAAAHVANATNFKVGGTTVGVPSVGNATAPAAPAGTQSPISANQFLADPAHSLTDNLSRIIVDVLGYFSGGGTVCPNGTALNNNGECIK